LLPVIGLIQTSDQARADRYMYLPLLGLVLPAASLLNRWRSRLPRGAGESLVVLVVTVFSWMTWHQVGYWKNSESLFRRAVVVTEDNAVMHLGLARSLDWVRESNEVLVHLQAAMAIEPENSEIYIDLARFYRYRGHRRWEQIHMEKAAFWKAADPSHLYRLD